MEKCFNAGAVTGTTYAGGLMGIISKHANVLYNDTSFTDCANIGTVTGGTAADLVAMIYDGSKLTVTNCGAFAAAGAFKLYNVTKAAGEASYTPVLTDQSAAEALTFMQTNCKFAMFGVEDNKIVVKTVPAEAKFLQYRKDTVANKMDIRVIGVINAGDLAAYENVGFNVSITPEGKEKISLDPQTTTVVYQTVNANEGGTITTFSANALGATYLYALELQNIPMEGRFTFEITAFATAGGSPINDSVVTVTIDDGTIQ